MLKNPLKEKMLRGEVAVGTFVNIYAPPLVEIIGYSGVEFIVIDDEHGAFSYSEIEDLVRTAELAGTTALVRVNYDNSAIQKALDRGAKGIQVPMVNSAADAEAVVRRAKFPPHGTRGTAYSVRAARFGEDKGKQYLDAADANTLVIVHIETPEAVANFDEIISVPGIDVAFIGPTDLSVTLGYKAEGAGHPEVQSVIRELFRKGREKGVLLGTLAAGPDDVRRCADLGAKFVITVASGLIAAKFKDLAKAGRDLRS